MKTHLMAMASAVALLAGWAAHAQSSTPLGSPEQGTTGSAPPAAAGLPTAGPDSNATLGTGMNPTTGGISDPAAQGSAHSGPLAGPADTGTASSATPHAPSTGIASGDTAAGAMDRMGGSAMGAGSGQGDTASVAGHLASNDRASLEQLIGRRVADTSGEQLGRIGDVILDTRTGQAQQAVIAMEQGGRNVAVDFTELHVPQDGKADIVLSTLNKEQLAALGAFSYEDSMVSLGGHGSGHAGGKSSGSGSEGSAADGTAGTSSMGAGSMGSETGGSRQMDSGTGTGTTAPSGSGSSRPEGSSGGMPTRP
ncbi:MAG TPA: PRC-barrel domain-containing protein [Azospirillaceae bacterium]|nr:PRC-barrel domain-containing protein [Azospirillaceae bacterium]